MNGTVAMVRKWRLRLLGMALVAFLTGMGGGVSLVHSGAWPVAVDGQQLPTLAPMLERITPAVVNIATTTVLNTPDNPLLRDPLFRYFFERQHRSRQRVNRSLGSGVVVDAARGHILTNFHVIEKADKITVTLQDGRVLQATRVGEDPETDLAVIKVEADDLTAIPLGDSDQLRVGDFVVAIGNPFGLGQTVTSGIVSALGRKGLGIEGYEDFIQTDASINPGNSGGALVNLRGELVGINTAILAPSGGNVGIGFAIPASMVRRVTDQLVTHGEVRRGLLGIQSQTLTPELAAAFGIDSREGAVVTRVTTGSAAERAGIQPGDVIIEANDRPVADAGALRNAVGLMRVGERVRLTLIRDGRRKQVSARVEEPQEVRAEGGQLDERLNGAVLAEAGRENGVEPGVYVVKVERGSNAWLAKLRPGDRLVAVNKRRVETIDALEKALKRQKKSLLIQLQRGQEEFIILVR